MGSFKKEVEIYTKIFPELLNNRNNNNQQRYHYIPRCFLGIGDNLIVLDDMSQSGYIMTDKFAPFNYDHCVILIRTIGKFHAKSMIYENEKKRTLYDDFSHCLHETLWPLKGVSVINEIIRLMDVYLPISLTKNFFLFYFYSEN